MGQVDHPVAPKELVRLMEAAGYHFDSSNPRNTLNPLLYGPGKLPFLKHTPGKGFELA